MQFSTRFAKCLSALTLLAACSAAHAGLDGKTFDGYYALPDPDTKFSESVSAPGSFVVGAGLETTITIEGVTSFAADFADASLDILFSTSLSNPTLNVHPFSGLVFNLLSAGPLDITSAQVGAATTLAGFDASRITFSDGRIAVDFNGLTYSNGTRVHIDFTSVSAVPEPATFALVLAGLAMVALATRRRNAQVARIDR